jgi:oligopeptidase B
MDDREKKTTRGAAVGSAGGIGVQVPLALREPVEHVIHGDRRVDHYAWMREKSDPRVREYLEAENAYADGVMRPTEGFQERLYQEMLGRIQQTDLSVPYLLRGWWYYTRTEEGKQYPIYCRKRASGSDDPPDVSSPEEVLLDLNLLSAGHTYMELGVFEVTDDGQRLAYATDTTGYRQYTLEVKDLFTGGRLPFSSERVTSAAWAADGRTLFYVTEDEVTKRSNQLWSVKIVTAAVPVPRLIYEEKNERFRMDVERSRSGAYLFLEINSHTTSEIRYLRADSPSDEFRLMAAREDEHEYYVDHHPGSSEEPAGGVFFIRTNSGGRTYRLMTAPTADPSRDRWREVIPNRPGVMLAGLAAFRTHLVLSEREDGLPYLRVVDLTREASSAMAGSRRIEFAEPTYSATLGTNPEFNTSHVQYTYESLVTPRSVYDYDVRTGHQELKKQQAVLGDFNSANYVSERLHARAKDGTFIPISVVRRKGVMRDGEAPLLLYGYGSYGLSLPVSFSSNRLSLLDRGMVYAIAHIRGGGELGKPWHDAGRMHEKMNTFTDFIASAEHLIAKRYTSEGRLAIEGGSAGGLLMGAVSNLRPDLFRVVVSHVPFVDVLNTMLDPTLPLTVGEYEEWGNPQLAEDYFYMKQYCPYTNVEHKDYPRMLVKTAWNDSQVMYWEAAKYVAKLRAMKTDGNVLLLKTNMGAGHGGASGRYDYLREIALDYAFLLGELEVRVN